MAQFIPVSDSQPALASNGIPASLQPYFQEYDFVSLNPERDAFTIIERTLSWGDIPEIRWLFARYGAARLRQVVEQYGWKLLPLRSYKFWLAYFDLEPQPTGERLWKS